MLLVACNANEATHTPAIKADKDASALSVSRVVTSEDIVARVNGEAITIQDVDFIMSKTFKSAELMLLNNDIRKKVLESLVASKAMKQASLQSLHPDELEVIQRRTHAYNEELFVKSYLSQNINNMPVTAEMVTRYYHENKEDFGAEKIKKIELIKTVDTISELKRNAFLDQVSTLKKSNNWKKVATKHWLEENDLLYQQIEVKPGLLQPELDQQIKQLKKGHTSDIVMLKGEANLIRVIDVKTLAPQPLAQVSNYIRKILAPIQLRKAVKAATDDVVKQANVEYIEK